MKTFHQFINECYLLFEKVSQKQMKAEMEYQMQLAQAHRDLESAKDAQRNSKLVKYTDGSRVRRQHQAVFFRNNPEEREQQDQIKMTADQRQVDALANIDALTNPQPQVPQR